MANYPKRPDVVSVSDVNSDNRFELLQSQLDAFLQQEKAAIAKAGPDSNESQRRLDYFINNLQHKLDSIMQSSGQAQQSLLQQEKKQSATVKFVIDMPVMSEPADSGSYSRLIFRVLIGASCVTAIVLWFLWPIGQVSQPPISQQYNDVGQSLSGLSRHEIMADRQALAPETEEPFVNKADADVLSHPVVVMPSPKKAALHDIPHVEKTVQVKPDVVVRLKVVARIGNIRDKPDRSGKVLFRLARGAVVTRLGEQKGWFHVRLKNGTIAWAHRSIF